MNDSSDKTSSLTSEQEHHRFHSTLQRKKEYETNFKFSHACKKTIAQANFEYTNPIHFRIRQLLKHGVAMFVTLNVW